MNLLAPSLRPHSLSIAIIFSSYVLQSRFHPFLDVLDIDSTEDTLERFRREGAVLNYVFKYNLLETVYLITSMFVLLSGLAFESTYLQPGTRSYLCLTYLVRGVSGDAPC